MRVSVISDLHIDFADLTLPGGDVLILSGDICEAKSIKKDLYKTPKFLAEHADIANILLENKQKPDSRVDRYYRFLLEECSQKYREVFMVMGNHEHYGFQFQKTFEHINSQLPSNIHLLEKASFELDGVLFLGATLWTDMNNHDSLTLYHMKGMMNDYRQITMFNEAKSAYHKLTPEFTVEEHIRTKEYFKLVLEENRRTKNLPVVVITHHSPSKQSTHPRYAHDVTMNGAYSSDLTEFILDNPEIKYWTHGHTHEPFRYKVGETEIICNPRGYKYYEHRAEDFDPTEGFDI
jgi:predicted phosphodiesterase